MGAVLPTALSLGWQTAKQALVTSASSQLYARIFKIFGMLVIGVPLLTGIYESWRKKQVINIHGQDFSKSFNPLTLFARGVQELKSSHRASLLETMPPSEASKIPLEKLSKYQLSLLASRADIVKELNSDKLLFLSLEKTIKKDVLFSTMTPENLNNLLHEMLFDFSNARNVLIPLFWKMNREQALRIFSLLKIPEDKRELFYVLQVYASKNCFKEDEFFLKPDDYSYTTITQEDNSQSREILQSLHFEQLKNLITDIPIEKLSSMQHIKDATNAVVEDVMSFVSSQERRYFDIDLFIKLLKLLNDNNAIKLIACLTTHPQKIINELIKKEKFIASLTSRQLKILLDCGNFNLDEKNCIFDLTTGNQIDHVDILKEVCYAYSAQLCYYFAKHKDILAAFFYSLDNIQIPSYCINKIKKMLSSIPINLFKCYLDQSTVNQFDLLFFSDDQLRSVDFKKLRFSKIECVIKGSSGQITMDPTTPEKWLEALCILFDEALVKEDIVLPDGTTFSYKSMAIKIPEAKKQLQKLSAKQVAFLYRRTQEMKYRKRVFKEVFSSQMSDENFESYLKEFDKSDPTIEGKLPDFTSQEAYKILGLKEGSSFEEIRKRWKVFCRECHPDKIQDVNEKKKALSRFQETKNAYEYFEKLNAASATTSTSGQSGTAGRP